MQSHVYEKVGRQFGNMTKLSRLLCTIAIFIHFLIGILYFKTHQLSRVIIVFAKIAPYK